MNSIHSIKLVVSTAIILCASFLTPKLAQAQTYTSSLTGEVGDSVTMGGNLLADGADIPATPGSMQFDLVGNEVFTFDSLAVNNLVLPAVSTTVPIGFSNVANVTITFNPISLTLYPVPVYISEDPTSVVLTPVNGQPVPTYNVKLTADYDIAYTEDPENGPFYLAGSYTISDSTGSTSGTFSSPIASILFQLNTDLVTTGYPDSVLLTPSGSSILDFKGSTPLFSTNFQGTTIDPTLSDATESLNTSGAAVETPEPGSLPLSACGLLLAAIGLRRRILSAQ